MSRAEDQGQPDRPPGRRAVAEGMRVADVDGPRGVEHVPGSGPQVIAAADAELFGDE